MSRRSFIPLNVLSLTADPGSASSVGADVYYNSTTSKFRYWNGSAWADLGAGGGSFTTSATAPVAPAVGDRWVNTTTGMLLTYINDGNSSQWTDFSASGVQAVGTDGTGNKTVYVGATAPAAPAEGDVWFDGVVESNSLELGVYMGMF